MPVSKYLSFLEKYSESDVVQNEEMVDFISWGRKKVDAWVEPDTLMHGINQIFKHKQ